MAILHDSGILEGVRCQKTAIFGFFGVWPWHFVVTLTFDDQSNPINQFPKSENIGIDTLFVEIGVLLAEIWKILNFVVPSFCLKIVRFCVFYCVNYKNIRKSSTGRTLVFGSSRHTWRCPMVTFSNDAPGFENYIVKVGHFYYIF